jgi:hypothetical protein
MGNIDRSKSVAMSIDAANLAHIISVLTDLYSDPAMAVIREYSTNAWDSHQEAGHCDPIEITLPDAMSPVFVVKDHGIGMSYEDLTVRYGSYGASSKRESDDLVGMLGLGCKSALTYAPAFTVVSVKDGVQNTVMITRAGNGVGEIDPIDERLVDLPDGVEVQIPVSGSSANFVDKAHRFYRFWQSGTVLIDGKPNTSIFDETEAADSTMFLSPDTLISNGEVNTHTIVMGNVPYPMPIPDGVVGYHRHIVARVDIGDVAFTPSREALQMTDDKTDPSRVRIAKIVKFVKDNLAKKIQEDIDKATSYTEALRYAVRGVETIGQGGAYNASRSSVWQSLEYKGHKMPGNLKMVGQSWNPGTAYGGGYRKASDQTSISLEALARKDTTILINHPKTSMNKEAKAKIHSVQTSGTVYVVWDMSDEDRLWIDGVNQLDWDNLRPPKKPRAKRAKNKVEKNTWYVWDDDKGDFATEDDLDPKIPTVYVFRNDSRRMWTREGWRKALAEHVKVCGGRTVLLSAGDINKFKKELPDAYELQAFFHHLMKEAVAKLDDDEWAWRTQHTYLKNLDPNEVLDPDLAQVVRRLQAAISKDAVERHAQILKIEKSTQFLAFAPYDPKRPKTSDLIQLSEKMHEQYPLIVHAKTQQALEYVNATYLYRKQGNET